MNEQKWSIPASQPSKIPSPPPLYPPRPRRQDFSIPDFPGSLGVLRLVLAADPDVGRGGTDGHCEERVCCSGVC